MNWRGALSVRPFANQVNEAFSAECLVNSQNNAAELAIFDVSQIRAESEKEVRNTFVRCE